MLRSCAARLRELGALRGGARAPARNLRPALRWFSSERDHSLPKPSWSKDFILLFYQFMKKCDDGSWMHYTEQDFADAQFQAYKMVKDLKFMKGRQLSVTQVLTRSFEEGLGFEYALFYNKDERRMVCLFQGGPLLQGFPGFLHGGAIATMIDSTISVLACNTIGSIMTATLNITYKRPIPSGLIVVINCQVDKIERRKVFLSCDVRSADGKTLHSEATSLCVKLDPEKNLI